MFFRRKRRFFVDDDEDFEDEEDSQSDEKSEKMNEPTIQYKEPTIHDIVRNILEITEKSGYDPETGTNWCHLPMEIRMECIKSMNFGTRSHLRACSKIEHQLVVSKKYHMAWVHIEDQTLVDCQCMFCDYEMGWGNRRIIAPFRVLAVFFQMWDIENLTIVDLKTLEPQELLTRIPIRCHKITLFCQDPATVLFMLRNCGQGVEEIRFRKNYDEKFPLSEIVHLPVVINAKTVEIDELKCTCSLHHLIKNWIRDKVAIGTKWTFRTVKGMTLPALRRELKEYVVEKGTGFIRFKMDCANQFIVVKRKTSRDKEGITCEIVNGTQSV